VRAIWRWRSVPGAHASISSATISPASPCCRKARKLEYLLADALANEALILVTEGAVQSNHAGITAAAAVIARLRSVLVLDASHGSEVAGNLLLDHLLGAQVLIVPDKAARSRFMASIGDELRAAGERPYAIPTGGSVPIGAVWYVAMVAELLAQLVTAGEDPSRLYFSTGSLGTQAGLVVGVRAFSAPFAVYGVAVEHPVEPLIADGVTLANGTAELLGISPRFSVPISQSMGRSSAPPTAYQPTRGSRPSASW
jgi:1-aminocyclopropane-1-carboxylate deaminase/D-cysteine desulfhydrase-like pyridoxal-dependent ACC family enzyme